MKYNATRLVCLAVAAWLAGLPLFAAPVTAPKIEHSPVTLAVRGQDVMIRTRVIPGTQPIKAVTLFYAVSRDAAPYKMAMQDSGAGWFTSSISSELTTGLGQLLYYIEARDARDATSETPWYTIAIKSSAGAPTAKPVAATANQKTSAEPERSWTKPALIAGGVVLAGGAAIALASGGGGGGGGGSGTTDGVTTNTAGTYSGTVTLCVQPPGSSSTCSSHAMTLVIDNSGTVSSDTLHEGKHLEGRLSGSTFLLVTSVTETNGTGEVRYLGTVVNNRIDGSIQGTLTTSDGTGVYSGNFSAVK